ncbi:MAG: hypothetical protein ACI9MR_002006 [Myxococcota bacterium]|jgi:hypothetical protein
MLPASTNAMNVATPSTTTFTQQPAAACQTRVGATAGYNSGPGHTGIRVGPTPRRLASARVALYASELKAGTTGLQARVAQCLEMRPLIIGEFGWCRRGELDEEVTQVATLARKPVTAQSNLGVGIGPGWDL